MTGLPSPIQYHIYTGQPLPPASPYAYVLAANGLFKLVDSPYFYASLRLAPPRVAGLCRWPESGVLLRVPRVPGKWLRAVLEDARKVCRDGSYRVPVEQMYHFHHFCAADKWPFGWQVSRPRQEASVNQVGYRGGHESTIVMDLHSHHTMDAFFSPTDNADAQGCRFDAVIGRIYTRPEIRVRLCLYGEWIDPFPALGLFEELGEFTEASRVVMGLDEEAYIDEELFG